MYTIENKHMFYKSSSRPMLYGIPTYNIQNQSPSLYFSLSFSYLEWNSCCHCNTLFFALISCWRSSLSAAKQCNIIQQMRTREAQKFKRPQIPLDPITPTRPYHFYDFLLLFCISGWWMALISSIMVLRDQLMAPLAIYVYLRLLIAYRLRNLVLIAYLSV